MKFFVKTAKERWMTLVEARAITLGLHAPRTPSPAEIARRNARRDIEARQLLREAMQ